MLLESALVYVVADTYGYNIKMQDWMSRAMLLLMYVIHLSSHGLIYCAVITMSVLFSDTIRVSKDF